MSPLTLSAAVTAVTASRVSSGERDRSLYFAVGPTTLSATPSRLNQVSCDGFHTSPLRYASAPPVVTENAPGATDTSPPTSSATTTGSARGDKVAAFTGWATRAFPRVKIRLPRPSLLPEGTYIIRPPSSNAT